MSLRKTVDIWGRIIVYWLHSFWTFLLRPRRSAEAASFRSFFWPYVDMSIHETGTKKGKLVAKTF